LNKQAILLHASFYIIEPARYNKAMPEEQTAQPGFEAGLEELENIVRELEKGDLPLEQSLALFENGMRLSAECRRQLENAETRVELLMRKGSEMTAVPFDSENVAK
jgi:exodeoxyribonuclease VII small subunit